MKRVNELRASHSRGKISFLPLWWAELHPPFRPYSDSAGNQGNRHLSLIRWGGAWAGAGNGDLKAREMIGPKALLVLPTPVLVLLVLQTLVTAEQHVTVISF